MPHKRLFVPTGKLMALESNLKRELSKLRRGVKQHRISKRTATIKGENALKQSNRTLVLYLTKFFRRKGVTPPPPESYNEELTNAIKEWNKLVNLL